MIDVQVSVIPIGTDSTSISNYVAESEKVLNKYPNLRHKLTAMSTEIEGNDIDEILSAVKEMHAAQLDKGVKRVQTSLRIDERRDKESTLSQKVASVKSKM